MNRNRSDLQKVVGLESRDITLCASLNIVCTDPRTLQKHATYTEWADAYSCTRHRCQPGGRNLAIYTVGCKRVEAPESAIECEEVVEDTNMQFPFCCTRLRCLVLVRGEVWTRVLGQPWETLPAAPWSHMYKMKKPPPGDANFLPKNPSEGPVYELLSDHENNEKVLRSGKKTAAETPDCNEIVPRASVPTPDIVIALSTSNDGKDLKKKEKRERHKRGRKAQSNIFEEENADPNTNQHNEIEVDEVAVDKEKPAPADIVSEEKYFTNGYGVTQKSFKASQYHQSWTEIPSNLWSDHETPTAETETTAKDGNLTPDSAAPEEKREDKPSNLQALVDAIGTRMRDIENVVQKMSEKVHQAKPAQTEFSGEKKTMEAEISPFQPPRQHHKTDKDHAKEVKTKRPNPDGDTYKRFSVRNRGSKYLHTTEVTTEHPVFIEDTSLNGYFSDASNNLVRRANQPKEPAPVYMAPVETRRKSTHIVVSETSEETDKKHKKRIHKKKKNKGKNHKKHHKDDKKKKVNKVSSLEVEKNVVSLEDSSGIASS
ncbi:unnamed protein product [Chilo suppressalis]|uniref:Single domain-containing protein n=1 Tax=Chilo suppressalis TaxID=168631 RepID=A0ABN8B7B0_CHISP|nr:unnamed protein product [Chilo suppressalis]